MKRTVICMKWGKAHASDYVNVLASAVRRNLHEEHRFVCLADDAEGISPDVETLPIPDMGLSPGNLRFGCWPKISLFKPELHDLFGRALYIDLDSMICGDLAPMFDVPGTLVMIKEWPRPIDRLKISRPVRGASGVIAFEIGALGHIYEELVQAPNYWTSTVRNDQRFTWNQQGERGVTFWPESWVISFKRHLLHPPLVNRVLSPRVPPPVTRILAFHGRPRSAELVPDDQQAWGDFWRAGRGAVPWFREYWLSNGGRETVDAIGPLRDWRGRPIN
ncbi:MAG: hypothetical protein OXH79_01475 [Boseongicola sp.]|nr:hypothetical protein [Boseongicola sp.]